MLSASDTATIVGSPSGTAATISTIHDINRSDTFAAENSPARNSRAAEMINTKTAQSAPISVTVLPSLLSFAESGDEPASSFSSPAILPISVPSPVSVTTILPLPETTKVPE